MKWTIWAWKNEANKHGISSGNYFRILKVAARRLTASNYLPIVKLNFIKIVSYLARTDGSLLFCSLNSSKTCDFDLLWRFADFVWRVAALRACRSGFLLRDTHLPHLTPLSSLRGFIPLLTGLSFDFSLPYYFLWRVYNKTRRKKDTQGKLSYVSFLCFFIRQRILPKIASIIWR